MFKLVVGILKGAIIGGALGYGAFALEQSTGFTSAWLTYGAIGALVGLVVGRPIWSLIRDKNATAWISILKAAFGFGIGCGLYYVVDRLWAPTLNIVFAGQTINVFTWSVTLGGAIGAVYGGFVELDDAIGDDKKPPASQGPAGAGGPAPSSPGAPRAPARKPPAKR